MLRRIVMYGLVGGAVAIALLVSTMFINGLNGLWSMAAGYLAMLIGLIGFIEVLSQLVGPERAVFIGRAANVHPTSRAAYTHPAAATTSVHTASAVPLLREDRGCNC